MNILPEVLQIKILIDSILLTRNEKGWNKIHYTIIKEELHLKKTIFIFKENVEFEKIIRLDRRLVYENNKRYIWLSQLIGKKNIYFYYDPEDYKYSLFNNRYNFFSIP